jgi:GntP family gluconate:H+ symporter
MSTILLTIGIFFIITSAFKRKLPAFITCIVLLIAGFAVAYFSPLSFTDIVYCTDPNKMIVPLIVSVLFIVVSTAKLKLHAFLALLLASLFFGICADMSLVSVDKEAVTVISSMEEGFGKTLGSIGIVIIAGTIIGTFLEKSGGVYALAECVLKIIGKKNVTPAMALIGYTVSIPVFADSGFVILTPLNKTLSKRAGLSLATTSIALAMGLMITHCLVPPTPGPIAAAGILGADLGIVIMLAIPISFIVLLFAWFWASKVASRVHIDPNPELTDEEFKSHLKTAPKAFHSFLPILIPIILIVLKSVADYPILANPKGALPLAWEQNWLYQSITFIGHPIIALLLGIGISLTLPKKFDRAMLSGSGWVGEGMLAAATIIMITGAGGAFGKVLFNSGIAEQISTGMESMSSSLEVWGLWLPFIAAAAIRAAQGSSTVAIMLTAPLLYPLLGTMGLDSSLGKALCVLSIGSGAMFCSHANDSFFWVVTQMTGMDVKTGYKLQTTGTILMGLFSCTLVWIVGLIWL